MIRKGYKRNRKKLLVLSLILIALLGAASFALYKNRSQNEIPSDQEIVTPPSGEINFDAPTEEEKNPARDQTTTPNQNNQGNGKKQVTPLITSADDKEARAYVPGVIEDGGTCTATFTQGQDKATANSQGFSNVSYTSCKTIKLSSPLNSGTWTVVVSYSSPASEGSSDPFNFEVP